jgi:hypothetical protein
VVVGEGGQLNCLGSQPGCGGGLSEPPHELELTTVPIVKTAIFSIACLLPIFSRIAMQGILLLISAEGCKLSDFIFCSSSVTTVALRAVAPHGLPPASPPVGSAWQRKRAS